MRAGENPVRDKTIATSTAKHRIIIPLYIPSEDDYYSESLKIFETCLDSLHKYSSYPFKLTVVANGCHTATEARLFELRNETRIDELILVKEPIGKLNSILKGLRATHERMVTITDADVLFLPHWDKAVFDVFTNFSKAAAVSPTPVFRTHNRLTHNIWFDYFFSNKLKFTGVVDKVALTRFAKSIGWSRLDEKWKDVILTLRSSTGAAVVGNSHFCVTYKRECLYHIPNEASTFQLGGDSELIYLDLPPVKCDGYRLATEKNYAFHIGNRMEDWVKEEMITAAVEKEKLSLDFKSMEKAPFRYWLKFKLFRKLMSVPFIKRWFYRTKGLNSEQLKNFAV